MLLTEDACAHSGGGGKIVAAVRPIQGRERVARFFLGLARGYADQPIAGMIVRIMVPRVSWL